MVVLTVAVRTTAILTQVQNCRKTGFHPEHQRNGQNAGNGVYEDCEHVRWTEGPLSVVDLRKGRR